MARPDTPAFSWVCPGCARRVPQKQLECRCGQVRPEPAKGSGPTASSSGEGHSSGPSHWGGWVLATAIVGLGLYWTIPRPARDRVAPTAVGPSRDTGSVPSATSIPPPTVEPATPSDNRGDLADASTLPPEIRPDSVISRTATDSPLEEVVARVMPAVVLVETPGGRGSGFFVKPDTIVTNAHVVGTETSVTIRRAGGDTLSARVASVAPELDLAVLKTSAPLENQPIVPLGSLARVRAGQEVVAIGSPLGLLQNSVTRGIVSAIRQLGAVTVIQTDAAINPGNSGGPLLDRHGDVIGITTMGVKAAQGLSFAVASDHAQQLLDGKRPMSTITPLASLTTTLQPAGAATGSDEIRQKGTATYEETLAQLARRADGLDEYWRRFKASCYEGRIAGTFERDWFALWNPKAMQGAVAPGCGATFDEVKRTGEQIRAEVLAAEEAARRADVYPGTRRDVRQKYRLTGLDR